MRKLKKTGVNWLFFCCCCCRCWNATSNAAPSRNTDPKLAWIKLLLFVRAKNVRPPGRKPDFYRNGKNARFMFATLNHMLITGRARDNRSVVVGTFTSCLCHLLPPPPKLDTPSFVVSKRQFASWCPRVFYGQVQERSDGRRSVGVGSVFGLPGVHHEELVGHGRQIRTPEIRKDRSVFIIFISHTCGHAPIVRVARSIITPSGRRAAGYKCARFRFSGKTVARASSDNVRVREVSGERPSREKNGFFASQCTQNCVCVLPDVRVC